MNDAIAREWKNNSAFALSQLQYHLSELQIGHMSKLKLHDKEQQIELGQGLMIAPIIHEQRTIGGVREMVAWELVQAIQLPETQYEPADCDEKHIKTSSSIKAICRAAIFELCKNAIQSYFEECDIVPDDVVEF